MILEHLSVLEDYIETYQVDAFEKIGKNLKVYVLIQFKNRSILYIKEIIIHGRRKYVYHWQEKNEELICRWDNAPHWPDIKTYPHHKHLKHKVVPSYETTTNDIFRQIRIMLEKRK